MFNAFYNLFLEYYEKHFPVIKISNKNKQDKLWINSDIKKQICIKNNLYKTWIQTKNILDKENYLESKRNCTKIIKEAKAAYYSKLFDKNLNSQKQLWKNLNKIY